MPMFHRRGTLFVGRHLRWVALAGAVGALLLVLGSRPASAAASLTASENPVAFTCGGPTTKTITLNWSLTAPTQAAWLTIMEGSNPLPGSPSLVTNPPGTGSASLAVSKGKTYTAQLRDSFTNATLASLTITTQGGICVGNPPPAGVLCAINLCITSHTVTPRGTICEVAWTTNKPAVMVLEVGNASGVNLVHSTSNVVKAFYLEPNTTYTYTLKATAQDGDTATKTGTCTTLKRRVQVTFDRIYMIDDSDDLSDCDCVFWFQADSATPKRYLDSTTGVPSGTNVYPNVSFTINNAADSLTLRVEGFDKDFDCFILSVCGCGVGGPPSFTTGTFQGDCGQYQLATAIKTVSTVPYGAENEAYTDLFQMTSPNSAALRFTAYGVYTVSYVP